MCGSSVPAAPFATRVNVPPAFAAPDIEKAKQLVKESGTAGQKVGIVVSDDEVNKQMGEYIQSVLNQIGYKATLKPISGNIQFTYIQNTKNKVQISVSQWYQDFPTATGASAMMASSISPHSLSAAA